MLNAVKLHDSQRFYEVTRQSKTYKCARVSDVIEQTSATPIYLKMWIVNCGIESIYPKVRFGPAVDIKHLKKIAWSGHQIKSQQAMDVGTKVHGWIKRGALDESQCDEESLACWNAYCTFASQYQIVPIAQEIVLYDIENLFAGTCDWIGTFVARKAISGQKKANTVNPHYTIYILDWKTSKAINDSYKLQVTVYKHMIVTLLKEFKKYPSRFDAATTNIINHILLAAGKKLKIVCGIVRLPKKPSARRPFEFVEVTKEEEKLYLKEFALMANLHNHRQIIKEKTDGNTHGR